MSPGHGITRSAQILGQILLYLCCGVEWHGIQMRVQFGKQPQTMTFHDRSRFDPLFVVGESFLRCQTCHPHIDARPSRVSVRIGRTHAPHFSGSGMEQDHVDVVVVLHCSCGSKFTEGLSFHLPL